MGCSLGGGAAEEGAGWDRAADQQRPYVDDVSPPGSAQEANQRGEGWKRSGVEEVPGTAARRLGSTGGHAGE